MLLFFCDHRDANYVNSLYKYTVFVNLKNALYLDVCDQLNSDMNHVINYNNFLTPGKGMNNVFLVVYGLENYDYLGVETCSVKG